MRVYTIQVTVTGDCGTCITNKCTTTTDKYTSVIKTTTEYIETTTTTLTTTAVTPLSTNEVDLTKEEQVSTSNIFSSSKTTINPVETTSEVAIETSNVADSVAIHTTAKVDTGVQAKVSIATGIGILTGGVMVAFIGSIIYAVKKHNIVKKSSFL